AMLPVGAAGAAARGAGLASKILFGMGTGAGIGGLQGASEGPDLTNAGGIAKRGAVGAGAGFLVGAALPAAGKATGASHNTLADALIRGEGISRPATKHLAAALLADSPTAVRARLNELGPDAMMADAGPALLGKAQGASLNSDEGRAMMVKA